MRVISGNKEVFFAIFIVAIMLPAFCSAQGDECNTENVNAATAEEVNAFIVNYAGGTGKSFMEGHGQYIVDAAKAWTLNPWFLVGITSHESTVGKAGTGTITYKAQNPGNIKRDMGYRTKEPNPLSGYTNFNGWDQGYLAMAKLVRQTHFDKGRKDYNAMANPAICGDECYFQEEAGHPEYGTWQDWVSDNKKVFELACGGTMTGGTITTGGTMWTSEAILAMVKTTIAKLVCLPLWFMPFIILAMIVMGALMIVGRGDDPGQRERGKRLIKDAILGAFVVLGFVSLSGIFVDVSNCWKGEWPISDTAISGSLPPGVGAGSGNTIVLDPGHGGGDSGATGGGMREADVNLDIAKRVKTILEAHGKTVLLTRSDGSTNPSFQDRAKVANDANADFFVSIHNNAGGGSGSWTIVYCYCSYCKEAGGTVPCKDEPKVHYCPVDECGVKNPSYEKSRDLARRMGTNMNNALGRGIVVNGGELGVLHFVNAPAVLVECLFIDNAAEQKMLKDEQTKQKIAQAIAESLF